MNRQDEIIIKSIFAMLNKFNEEYFSENENVKRAFENTQLKNAIKRIGTYRRIEDGYTDVNTAINDALKLVEELENEKN